MDESYLLSQAVMSLSESMTRGSDPTAGKSEGCSIAANIFGCIEAKRMSTESWPTLPTPREGCTEMKRNSYKSIKSTVACSELQYRGITTFGSLF